MKQKIVAIGLVFIGVVLFFYRSYNVDYVGHRHPGVAHQQKDRVKTADCAQEECTVRDPLSCNPEPPLKVEIPSVEKADCTQEECTVPDPLSYDPEPPLKVEIPDDCNVILPQLEQIIIYGDAKECAQHSSGSPSSRDHHEQLEKEPEISPPGITFKNIQIPGGEDHLRQILSRFLNKQISCDDISEMKLEIVNFFRNANYPIVYISIPSKFNNDATLEIHIYQGRLGEVNCLGNHYFSDDQLKKYIRVQPGELINVKALTEDLDFINRNTFRQSDVIFKAGKEPGTTDIDLITKDRRKWRVYVGADNTGMVNTGEQRYYTGINLGNLFDRAHMLTYQFTSGPSYNEFYSHTLNYLAPISARSLIQVFGGFSRVKGNMNFPDNPGYATHGKSMQGSLRYDITLPPGRNILHDFSIGGDWKNTNVQMLFARELFFKTAVNITQLYAGYNLGVEGNRWKFPFVLEAFWSPGKWLGDQENANFNALRQYATNHYFYSRLAFSPLFRISKYDFFISMTARGQYSTQNLLSSEEIGIGGYDTVRGYNEQQLNGDSGVITNLEIRSPYLHIMKYIRKKNNQDSLQFLIFTDYGLDILHKPQTGVQKTNWIASYGAGARYQWETNLSARLDYGRQLHHVVLDSIDHKWHFGVTASY